MHRAVDVESGRLKRAARRRGVFSRPVMPINAVVTPGVDVGEIAGNAPTTAAMDSSFRSGLLLADGMLRLARGSPRDRFEMP